MATEYYVEKNLSAIMRVVLTESQYKLLREFKKELTFYSFYVDTLDFLKALLDSPFNAEISDRMKNHGITKQELIKSLSQNHILKRVPDKVKEVPIGEDSDDEPIIVRKYTVLKPNFDGNLRKVHKSLCESKIPKRIEKDEIEECDCAGAMQGGGANLSAGTYDVPFSGMISRSVYKPKSGKKKKKK